jgi:hypothetical protein
MEHVARLAAASELPPIRIWEFQPGKFRGVDGYHRWRLAKARGARDVEAQKCRFPAGDRGERDFQLECIRSNIQHGLPLTREQRDRAILQIWNHWGRCSAGPENGVTLEQLGKLFNLTKARIHQIVSPKDTAGRGLDSSQDFDSLKSESVEEVAVKTRPGRFSTFGRFSAAAVRLSKLLGDEDFVGKLFRERDPNALKILVQLRSLIDSVLTGPGHKNSA